MSVQVGISVRGKRHTSVLEITPIRACDESELLILRAGFKLCWQSNKSEARYFSFQGRHGTVRIATHAKNYKMAGLGMDNMARLGPVICSVTFPEGGTGKHGLLRITQECIEFKTATAIGIYFIRANASPAHQEKAG